MDEKRSPEELLAQLCLEPGFVLVPQDRFEELVRAEAERDVLEVVILGDKSYNVDVVMAAIKKAPGQAGGRGRCSIESSSWVG